MTKTKLALRRLPAILTVLLLAVSFLLFWSAEWFVDTNGRLGFDAILFSLSAGLEGTSHSLITNFILTAAIPATLWTIGTVALLFWIPIWIKRYRHGLAITLSVMLSLGLLSYAAWNTELDNFILNGFRNSDLYENYYADPKETAITFPEEKRNLIYIILESMETTYLSTELGGAMEENLIPELYHIALENTNFSHNTGVGGFHCMPGSTWTIGSLVAQTSGIPLKTPATDMGTYGKDGSPFLPGATSLNSVLADAGYYQALMVGSDAAFGGRDAYFSQHGVDTIYDLFTARADGIVPQDYFVWWGMEDAYLFEYAKQELPKIAQREEPFAFTMLTVDTHHIGGYQCDYCPESTSSEPYDRSISCSSRQVAEFLSWLETQDFYENTTVILVGDHRSMDNGYFTRNTDSGYQRMLYNCFINAAVETENTTNRQFAAVDLFPTTLAALGCQIEGDRLGLGTNLFSSTPTLTEALGLTNFQNQLAMGSKYYENNFYK